MSIVYRRGDFLTPRACSLLACVVAAGCVTSDPARPDLEAFSSPAAIEIAGGARIALQQHVDSGDGPIVITTLDFATGTVSPLVPVTGAHGAPRLAGNDTRAYMTWFEQGHSYGALLHTDQSLGHTFDYCDDCTIEPFAVGARFLVVESRYRQQDARWVEADGTVGASFAFPGAVSKVGSTSAGSERGATMVRRLDNTYAVVTTDGFEVELDEVESMWSVAVMPDGGLLATFASWVDGHTVHVTPDGLVTERVTDDVCLPRIRVAADRAFGLCAGGTWEHYDIVATTLDASGAFADAGTTIAENVPSFRALEVLPMFSIGRDLLLFDRSAWPEAIHFDGDQVSAPMRIAGGYTP